MPRDPRAFLWDIADAAADIAQFIDRQDAEGYAQTALVRAAVERKFEIVGEALGQLARLDPALAARIPDYRRIIAFRNILIHGYASIDHAEAWRIATTALPNLNAAVVALMNELGAP